MLAEHEGITRSYATIRKILTAEWFGGKTKFTLRGGINGATGKITGAYMTKNECLQGYFEIMRQIITQNGVPIAVYADRHAIFQSPKADKLTVEEQLRGRTVNGTQFGRAMKHSFMIGFISRLICCR